VPANYANEVNEDNTMTDSASQMNAADFASYQQRRRKELWGLLGDLPPWRKPAARLLRTEEGPGYRLEHLELDTNGIEPVPALLLVPHKRRDPAPGLLYLHAHGDQYEMGKEELIEGLEMLQAYAPVCAEKGLVTLAIDNWCFSGRRHCQDGRQGEHDAFKLMLWRGQVLWGMMLFDQVQALTYLAGRPEVDPQRIGAFGLSMGSTMAWWLAALDTRVRLCVDLCCLTDFEELIRTGNLAGHGVYYYVPRLLQHFQTHEIRELIVPRPQLSLNGRRDPLTPPAGVERVRDHLALLYEKYGRPDECRVELFDCGHEETPEIRAVVLDWLDEHLAIV